MDGTGSGLCPMVKFGINGVKPSGSVSIQLVSGLLPVVCYQS